MSRKRTTPKRCQWQGCYKLIAHIWYPAKGHDNPPVKVCPFHGGLLLDYYPDSSLMTCIG